MTDLNKEQGGEELENSTPPEIQNPDAEPAEPAEPNAPERKKKKRLSGAYWYVETDEETLSKNSFNRSILTVIALLLQMVVLIFPQGSLEYTTKHYPSFALAYMFTVFIMLGTSIYVIIMNKFRYLIAKRIPVERAPKYGFKHFVYFGTEFFVIVNFVLFCMEIAFVAINYDGYGLAGVFVTAAATAAAVWSRMITFLMLRNAERIKPNV